MQDCDDLGPVHDDTIGTQVCPHCLLVPPCRRSLLTPLLCPDYPRKPVPQMRPEKGVHRGNAPASRTPLQTGPDPLRPNTAPLCDSTEATLCQVLKQIQTSQVSELGIEAPIKHPLHPRPIDIDNFKLGTHKLFRRARTGHSRRHHQGHDRFDSEGTR